MGDFARKADGRRTFTAEFKRSTLEKQVRELQRLVNKQAMTIEILEAAREVVKESPHLFKGSKR